MALPNISNVSRPRAMGYGCRINNDYYRLFTTPDTPVERSNAELQTQRIDATPDPETISQDFGVSFSRFDFSGGEGLRLAHLANNPENAYSMFWDSGGIEAHTHDQSQRAALKLLKDIDQVDTLATSNIYLAYDKASDRLYLSSGQSIKFTDNPNAATPTYTTEDPHAGQAAVDVQDIAFYGGELYVALGVSGIHKRDSGGVYTDVTDPAITSVDVNKVWNVKQRIIFTSGNELWEMIDPAVPDAALRLTIEEGFVFNSAYDSGGEILVSATDGYVYALNLDESTNSIQVAGRFNISGEVPAAMTGLDAVTLLTTYQPTPNGGFISRVWLIAVQEGALANRQIIKEFGNEETNDDFRIMAADTQRNHAFLGVNEDTRTHLWHYDFATAGIFRHMGGVNFIGQVVDVVHVGSRPFWSIAGQGLFRQSTDNVISGYVISPLADNFTRDRKSWSGVIVDAEGIGGTAKINIYYSTNVGAIYDPDHPTWMKWITISNTDAVNIPHPISNLSSRYITIKIELEGDASNTPHFNSFTVLSSPGQSDIVYTLPINVSDLVTRPYHGEKMIPGLGRKLHDQLKSVQGSSVTLEVLDPHEVIQGTVMNIQEPIPFYTRRGSPVFVAQTTVRGRRIPGTGVESISTSTGSVGIGLLGVMFIGGPENET